LLFLQNLQSPYITITIRSCSYRNKPKVGGKYEGKIIREITDDGLTVHDPEISTGYFVPYEDTPI